MATTARGLESFFFGPAGRRLFGCFEGPRRGAAGCTVLCSSVGHDRERFHRAHRQLAARLAAAGQAVLRFDLRGSGDSAGELASTRFADWLADLDLAVRIARELASREVSCILGHRIGAGVVLTSDRLRETDRLVLWDPVLSGDAYLEDERRRHRRMLRRTHLLDRLEPAAGTEELLGEQWSTELLGDLRRALPPEDPAPPPPRVLLVDTAPGGGGTLPAAFGGAWKSIERTISPAPELWSWAEDITRMHVPHRILDAIVAWVGAGEPGR